MRILGIDPGYATVGLGLVDAVSSQDIRCGEWLTIRTAAGLPFPDRLAEIHRDLSEFLAETRPELAVVEKLYFGTNTTTAIDVSQARGVIVLALTQANVRVMEATPLQMKLAITGDGSAEKRQVQDMMVRMLGLSAIPQPDDAADALGLAVYGALQMRTLELPS
jgi:crossover junction endodeoxyribonuclease RuvC